MHYSNIWQVSIGYSGCETIQVEAKGTTGTAFVAECQKTYIVLALLLVLSILVFSVIVAYAVKSKLVGCS